MNIDYRQIQIGLLFMLVGLFMFYVTLDSLGFELTAFGTTALTTLWSMMLILVDVKAISEMIRKTNGIDPIKEETP